MRFIMPGQGDVLEGREAFRRALDGLGEILPPGFEITGLRQIEGENEVVSIMEWTSENFKKPITVRTSEMYTTLHNVLM